MVRISNTHKGLLVTQEQLDAMLERAGKLGAEACLKELGLDDKDAVYDIREWREMIRNWRMAKKTFVETIIKAIATAFITVMMAGLAFHYTWGGAK